MRKHGRAYGNIITTSVLLGKEEIRFSLGLSAVWPKADKSLFFF